METTDAVTLPEFPQSLVAVARLVRAAPGVRARFAADLVYPYGRLAGALDREQRRLLATLYRRVGIAVPPPADSAPALAPNDPDQDDDDDAGDGEAQAQAQAGRGMRAGAGRSGYRLLRLERAEGASGAEGHAVHALLQTEDGDNADQGAMLRLRVRGGPRAPPVWMPPPAGSVEPGTRFVGTAYHARLLAALVLAHAAADVCLIGPRGVGKSALVRQFARALGSVPHGAQKDGRRLTLLTRHCPCLYVYVCVRVHVCVCVYVCDGCVGMGTATK
jgi:hypothetical protein